MKSSLQNQSTHTLRIGTAGWSIPTPHAHHFPSIGPSLGRYSQILPCAEINSTFYRPHRPSTYIRWAAATPSHFRFSVKAPRSITHESRLNPAPQLFETFLLEVRHLGDKLGPLLFQLPPRQAFDHQIAHDFFTGLRNIYPTGPIALEPRHPTWFSPEVEAILQHFRITRVIADPSRSPASTDAADATQPVPSAGHASLLYFRLHGSPRTYYSIYTDEYLEALAANITLHNPHAEIWVIFDNTASGAAIQNALHLIHAMRGT